MAGTLFEYVPGKLEVRFEHGYGDTIEMYIKMHGANVITTDCDDQFKKDDPIDHQSPSLEFKVYMTSCFCPFVDYISFLEAITTQVKECSFGWDAEGPDCILKWSRRFRNKDGFLTIEWIGKDHFEHRMHLETKQVVGEMYQSFRSFVESDRYDPLRYEEVTIGERLYLGLGERYSLKQISNHIQSLNVTDARKLIDSIFERSYQRNGLYEPEDTWPEGLDELRQPMEFSKCLLLYGVDNSNDDIDHEKLNRYVEESWDSLDADAREAYLEELFNYHSICCWHGDNLR